MLQEDIVLPRASEPPFLSALHAKNWRDKKPWTNLFGYKLGESTENKKGPLFFWGKETIQTFNSLFYFLFLFYYFATHNELQAE